jgi:hypothetical protein
MRRALLIQALAYRLQEKALGGLRPATRRLLASAADDAAARRTMPEARERKIKPGTTLLREWHGVQHRLTVLEDGVQFGGERYRSLSEVARNRAVLYPEAAVQSGGRAYLDSLRRARGESLHHERLRSRRPCDWRSVPDDPRRLPWGSDHGRLRSCDNLARGGWLYRDARVVEAQRQSRGGKPPVRPQARRLS